MKKKIISLQIRTCGGRDIDMRLRPGLVGREVATRKWFRDLAGLQWVSGLASGN